MKWAEACKAGFFEEPSLQAEGFIHNCTLIQVPDIIEKFYKNKSGLLLLSIDETLLTAPLKYEMSASLNESFPHLFGVLNIEAVVKTASI